MPDRPTTPESGFSLAELLIGVFLTLVVLATTLGALADGIRVGDTADLLSEMQHNARTGLNLMTRDLMQAGQGIPTGGIPIPSGGVVSAINRPAPSAMTFPATWVVLPAVSPGQALGPDVQGRATDIISILYADTTLALNQSPLADIAADGSTMTVDAGTPITDPDNAIAVGDFIIFSNAMGNAIQEVTAVSGTQTVTFGLSDSMNFNQRSAPQGTIMQLQSAPGVFPPTTATRIWMVSYYVGDSNPASPRLMRVLNNGTPRPIALDIEDLQLTYDVVDGTLNSSNVDDPVAPNSPAQIRKVNLLLAARSHARHETTGQYQRQTLTTQVSLRSLSFLDRYQ